MLSGISAEKLLAFLLIITEMSAYAKHCLPLVFDCCLPAYF